MAKIVFITVVILSLYTGYLCEKLVSTKTFDTDSTQFVWNFYLSDDVNELDFNGVEILADSPEGVGEDREPLGVNFHPPGLAEKFKETPARDSHTITGIYWRPWENSIPHDAIVGGHTSSHCGLKIPIYMGQVYVYQHAEAGVQPGQLFNYSMALTTTFEGVRDLSKSVKILCGDQHSVAWVPVGRTSSLNPETDFVAAGFERDFEIYFARTRHEGRRFIGKMVVRDKIMHFPLNGQQISLTNFDVLCYRKRLRESGIRIPDGQLD